MKAEIIQEKCPAVKDLCQPLKQCPQQAILYENDISAPLGVKIFIDNDKCDGCGICIALCCGNAIYTQN